MARGDKGYLRGEGPGRNSEQIKRMIAKVPRDAEGRLRPYIMHIETNRPKKEQTMTNFQDILATRADTIEAPKTLPVGKYSATVKGFETGISTQKKTPYVEIKFSVEGIVDVQPDLEAAASEALSKGPIEMRSSYYLTEKSTYRLLELLERDLGISKSGKLLGDMLTEATGQSCALVLDIEVSKDGREFVTIKRTARL